MSCDITVGRKESCRDSVGGVKAVYFVNYGDMGVVTFNGTSDIVQSVAGAPSAYKFEVRGISSYIENIQASKENGTVFFEQVLELVLNGLSTADHKTVKLLSYGKPHIIIENNNGEFLLAGLENGCDVTGGTISTGTAMGDRTGYSISFTGMEKIPACFIERDDVAGTLVGAGFTAVLGV